ncbi:hypothetical protein WKW80_36835, partial [Variovorax humicola]
MPAALSGLLSVLHAWGMREMSPLGSACTLNPENVVAVVAFGMVDPRPQVHHRSVHGSTFRSFNRLAACGHARSGWRGAWGGGGGGGLLP